MLTVHSDQNDSYEISINGQNKTKYTMDPGMYYLLEADKDNTNRY